MTSVIIVLQVKEDESGRECSTNGETRNAYRLLVGKPVGNRPLERQRRRWVVNIKMNLGETGWSGIDWVDMVLDRDQSKAFVYTVMSLRVP
jgi:hypothetical protein